MNRYFEALELHKILELLSNECSNKKTRQMALSLKPCTDVDDVRLEINKTTDAFDLSVRYGTPAFYNFIDITEYLRRADSGAVLSLAELIEIRRVLHQISELSKWHNQSESEKMSTSLDYLFESLFPNQFLERKLEVAILSEDELADDASPELASIRRKISRAGLKIRETMDTMIKSSTTKKYLQESIITLRDGRYVLPVKTEFKNEVSGLIHDTSSSGATLFIEPMSVVEANNDIRILKGEEQDEIRRIMAELSSMCAEIKETLTASYNAAVELNLYFSKANLAASMRATTPEISDDGEVVLKKARHPLINKDTVVPIDFELGTSYRALIITGPNTGGKTVILKTVGLLTAMTMCGLLIPVSDGSKISVFENILVDIGDRQSIEESLSTFSSHMNRVIEILSVADEKTLVLLDELGSGTDPLEGAALAVSIIEQLKAQGSSIVTTTHYQELKMYALDTDNVQNASCEFNSETFKPTYRLIIGTPGKSNAFKISQQLGLSETIIDNAQQLISDDNKRFEEILEALEKSRIELDESKAEAKRTAVEMQKLRDELESEKAKLTEQKEKELEIARREANAIVKRVSAQADKLLDELSEIRKQKEKSDFAKNSIEAKHIAKSALNHMYDEANPIVTRNTDAYVLPRPLIKGDSVLISDINKKGIVVTPPDDSDFCFIQSGIMKTKVHVSKLRLVEKENTLQKSSGKQKKTASSVTTKGVESRMTRRPQLELDIRGYAADDGIYEVDSFLDNAVMSGVGSVTIIHGKGTGVLKNAVRNHLRHHPHVASSRKGLYGEGEDGVTVVELK